MSGPPPQPRSGQRTGIVEGWELRQAQQKDANSGAWKGLAFIALAIVLIVAGGWFVGRPYIGGAVAGMFEDSPGIINLPVVSDLLAAELSDRVNAPAGTGTDEIEFVIEPGETVDDIKANLVEEGLLSDALAFQYLVVSDRVDQLIRAGIYTMTPEIAPEGIVGLLVRGPDPPVPTTVLDMRTQRRIEQVVAYLQQQTENTDLELDPKEFLQVAREPRAGAPRDLPVPEQSPWRQQPGGVPGAWHLRGPHRHHC